MTSSGISLAELYACGVGHTLFGDGSVELRGVRHDSRKVGVGDLFVALAGEEHDGRRYVDDAARQGASAVLSGSELSTSLPLLVSDQTRIALAQASHLTYGSPTEILKVVGITGTNGKSTTAHLVDVLLRRLGQQTALLGTIGQKIRDRSSASSYTTPESDSIARFAAEALEEGCSHLTMEVSSHGLAGIGSTRLALML